METATSTKKISSPTITVLPMTWPTPASRLAEKVQKDHAVAEVNRSLNEWYYSR